MKDYGWAIRAAACCAPTRKNRKAARKRLALRKRRGGGGGGVADGVAVDDELDAAVAAGGLRGCHW